MVPGPAEGKQGAAELVVKHGYGHGWITILLDMPTIADWFDKYLAAPGR